ncbi:MAG: hypothetical protein JXR60_04890 [Bacteroidales bacterium]|nr:hypothetical protein [Bacteroidales bacterium]
MNSNKIKILLEKYFEGNTNLSEEQILKAYFSKTESIPQDLAYAKSFFNYLEDEKNIRYAEKKKKKYIGLWISSIAASLILIGLIIFQNINPAQENTIVYAYVNGKAITNKAEAMAYTREAMATVSKNLDKGTKHLNQLQQFNKVEQLIKKERQ